MQVKGEVLVSLPLFILKKFGKQEYERWLKYLLPEAKAIYSTPINKSDWYPIRSALIEPTNMICKLFYSKNLKGAFECGRFSAEYGLKGLYKVLVKLSSPDVLINRASKIMRNYYQPSEIEVVARGKNSSKLRIAVFPEMTECIEQRIAGWMQRAVEISGSSRVDVKIPYSLTKNDPFTEFDITWKKNVL